MTSVNDRPALLLACVVEMAAGHEAAGQAYENAVLDFLGRHGGVLEKRVRALDGKSEVHLIRFDEPTGYESFMVDPERLALRDRLGEAAPVTRVIEVAPVR